MGKLYLAKTKKIEKLSRREQEELVFDLVNALVQAQTVSEAALFLQDLLTKSEMKMLAKRLRVAKLLLGGMTYKQIEENLHVGHSTVAKIAAWLAERLSARECWTPPFDFHHSFAGGQSSVRRPSNPSKR